MSVGAGAGGTRAPGRSRTVLRAVATIAVALAALLLLGAGRKVESDPKFCATSCHHAPGPRAVGASADWHAAGHSGIACQKCHETSLATGLRLLWQTYTNSATPVAHGQATPRACVGCHEKNPAQWRLVAETAGHRDHHEVKGVDCLSCHASTAHVSAPPEKVCTSCHKDDHLHKSTVVGAETCLSCHSFAITPKNMTPPTTVACEKCHADATTLAASAGGTPVPPMRVVDAHALHGGVACQLCHNAHGIKPTVPQGQPVCARCHQFENFQVGNEQRSGPAGHRDCEGCHKPHAPTGTAILGCINCHAKNAKGLLDNGEAVVTTALRHKNCASCHVPHTWKAERSGCMQCHKEQTQLLQTRSPPEHKACTDCHDVHGPPPTGAVCLKCHSDTKSRHVALAPERHKDCTSCHNPHAPKPEDTRTSCAKCHSEEVTQLARDGPEGHLQDSCFGCHKPHDNPMPPENVCSKCHRDKATLVSTAGPPKHRVCISCHEKHVFRITDVVAACTRCHENLFDAAARGIASVPHQADCKTCHTFHGEPGVARASCLGCHEKVASEFEPINDKHADCGSCHKPHTPASAAPEECRKCHADKAAIAAMWPPSSAHAQACNLCHQQHDVKIKKACAECHATEAASLASGPAKHRCESCHAPHVAPPGQGPAWWQSCGNGGCHAAKVQSVKQRGPTHSACKNCHQPHEFGVPTCISCHKDITSEGLHAVQQHAANCNACHDPHVKSVPTRQQCLACHTNRANHQPDAVICNTCHIFTGH
jgi:hypothetical protein